MVGKVNAGEPPALQGAVHEILKDCTECGLCQRQCMFLKKYGKPKPIGAAWVANADAFRDEAFECSLCELCNVSCPVGLNPARMFLEMRREARQAGAAGYSKHSRILGYEKRGTSRRYSYYALPEGCGTVFFPGCTLAGTRPDKVLRLYEHLLKGIPGLGVVLDCCTKPSHDLGRTEWFELMFQEMLAFLLGNGVKTVLTACASCHRVFKDYGDGLKARTVYEVLAEGSLPPAPLVAATVTIHDPCTIRSEGSIHSAVREVLRRKGAAVEEMPHSREKALCCGEGGSVGFISPEMAGNWARLRADEAGVRRVITYCAGCDHILKKKMPTGHLLDLLFDPGATLSGKAKVSRAPITYWNRLRLKSRFKKLVNPRIERERTFSPPDK